MRRTSRRNTHLRREGHSKLRRFFTGALVVTSGLSLVSGCDAAASASSPRRGAPVLGQKRLDSPGATGWGTFKPDEFFNGGDPSGRVLAITWKDRGSRSATGTGRGFLSMPKGGYYPGSVREQVRAFDLGHCTSHGPLAYGRSDVRYPSPPGGRLGQWAPWSESLCVTTAMSTTTTTQAGDAAPPCHDGQISLSEAGGGMGLGHRDEVIVFTNQSRSACFLSGYPGVDGLDAQGREVVQAERTLSDYLGGLWNGATAPPIVTVPPAQKASATVEGTDTPTGSATSCPFYPALLVTPPNFTTPERVPVGLLGCSPIEVHPVVSGSSGRMG